MGTYSLRHSTFCKSDHVLHVPGREQLSAERLCEAFGDPEQAEGWPGSPSRGGVGARPGVALEPVSGWPQSLFRCGLPLAVVPGGSKAPSPLDLRFPTWKMRR